MHLGSDVEILNFNVELCYIDKVYLLQRRSVGCLLFIAEKIPLPLGLVFDRV
jgi:hypothetical protein